MRVLLLQPPFEDFYATPIRFYPLGLLYAAAVFERVGWTVGILDCLSPLKRIRLPVPKKFSYLRPYLDDPLFFSRYYQFGLSDEEILSRIRNFSPDLVGISSQFTAYFKSVGELAELIKAHLEVPVILGGHHASIFAEAVEARAPGVDAVLRGPAEASLPDYLVPPPARSGQPTDRRTGEPVDWKLLRPAHHLVDGGAYRIGTQNAISLTAGRGCPHGCEFCAVDKMFGRSVSFRDVEKIVEEMRWNYLHKETRIFNFEDDNLVSDKEWFLSFLEKVSEDPLFEGIELTAMNGICYSDLDESVLSAMARAGFRRINLSLVTRSGELRKSLGRPSAGRDLEEIVKVAGELGFHVTVYVIIGLPGQSYEEVRASIDFLLGLGVLVGPSVFYLSPGSPIFDKIQVSARIREDWDFYRSSAFAVETENLSRRDLIDLFLYCRRRNLENRRG